MFPPYQYDPSQGAQGPIADNAANAADAAVYPSFEGSPLYEGALYYPNQASLDPYATSVPITWGNDGGSRASVRANPPVADIPVKSRLSS